MDGNDVIEVVDHLKDVLTPVGEHVYEVYYRQMMYTGIIQSFIDSVLILIGMYVAYRTYKYTRDTKDDDWVFTGVIVSVICLVFGFMMLSFDIMKVLNPDYYIIQDLLGNI